MEKSVERKAESIETEVKQLRDLLRKEMIKVLKLRMRMAVLIQHPKGMAAEKIAEMTRADFGDTIIHLN